MGIYVGVLVVVESKLLTRCSCRSKVSMVTVVVTLRFKQARLSYTGTTRPQLVYISSGVLFTVQLAVMNVNLFTNLDSLLLSNQVLGKMRVNSIQC